MLTTWDFVQPARIILEERLHDDDDHRRDVFRCKLPLGPIDKDLACQNTSSGRTSCTPLSSYDRDRMDELFARYKRQFAVRTAYFLSTILIFSLFVDGAE